jgi:pimeloyl-CoA synthetase
MVIKQDILEDGVEATLRLNNRVVQQRRSRKIMIEEMYESIDSMNQLQFKVPELRSLEQARKIIMKLGSCRSIFL